MRLIDTLRLFLEVAPREAAVRVMLDETIAYMETVDQVVALLAVLLPDPKYDDSPIGRSSTAPEVVEIRHLLASLEHH